MGKLLFSAHSEDWSGQMWFDDGTGYAAGGTCYRIYDDGICESGCWQEKMSPELFARMQELFSGDFLCSKTHNEGNDGEAWSMILYDRNGNIIHETGLGYIYNVPALEELVRILHQADPLRQHTDGHDVSASLWDDLIWPEAYECHTIIHEQPDDGKKQKKDSDECQIEGIGWV